MNSLLYPSSTQDGSSPLPGLDRCSFIRAMAEKVVISLRESCFPSKQRYHLPYSMTPLQPRKPSQSAHISSFPELKDTPVCGERPHNVGTLHVSVPQWGSAFQIIGIKNPWLPATEMWALSQERVNNLRMRGKSKGWSWMRHREPLWSMHMEGRWVWATLDPDTWECAYNSLLLQTPAEQYYFTNTVYIQGRWHRILE